MHVLIINFRLEGMDEEGYRAAGAELAPAFAELPGLLANAYTNPRLPQAASGVDDVA